MLPDDMHVTVAMAADFYEVAVESVKKIMMRHRVELKVYGVGVLTKGELLRLTGR